MSRGERNSKKLSRWGFAGHRIKREHLPAAIREHLASDGVLANVCEPKLCLAQVWAAFAQAAC